MVFYEYVKEFYYLSYEFGKDNATPLFDWGKYFERDGRILLPFSVQAHHSFVDGIHVGKLADALQKFVEEY